jgi:hypothetical protein
MIVSFVVGLVTVAILLSLFLGVGLATYHTVCVVAECGYAQPSYGGIVTVGALVTAAVLLVAVAVGALGELVLAAIRSVPNKDSTRGENTRRRIS